MLRAVSLPSDLKDFIFSSILFSSEISTARKDDMENSRRTAAFQTDRRVSEEQNVHIVHQSHSKRNWPHYKLGSKSHTLINITCGHSFIDPFDQHITTSISSEDPTGSIFPSDPHFTRCRCCYLRSSHHKDNNYFLLDEVPIDLLYRMSLEI